MSAAPDIRRAPPAAGSATARFRPSSYNAEARTVELIAATATPVQRFGDVEVLRMEAVAWDLSLIDRGGVLLLDAHRADSIDATLGRVVSARIESGQLLAVVAFADTARGREAEGMVARGELGAVSVGYRVKKWTPAGRDETGRDVFIAEAIELLEISIVPVPADPAARVRSFHHGDLTMETEANTPANRAAPPAGAAEILSIGTRAGFAQADIDAAIRAGESVDTFRARAFDHLAARAAAQGATSNVRVIRDEGDTSRRGMTEALAARMGATVPANGPGEAFRGVPIYEMAARHIGERGRLYSVADREEVLRRAFHTTSDYPFVFEAALRQALGQRYTAATPVHRRIGVERTVPDFRPMSVTRPGDFPALQSVNQAGEIRFGTFGEQKETLAVAAYGVQFNVSRQMLVNDNLGAIDQMLQTQAQAVALFEDRIFFGATLLAGSGAGPTMGDGLALFHATHSNLGSATAITAAALGAGRLAMRRQKGIPSATGATDGLDLNVEPWALLCSPEKETEADTVLAIINPATTANVNVFSGSLTKIVSPLLTGNAWYILADPARTPSLAYVRLEGFEAPRLRIEQKFGTQGVGIQLEHDFGAGAIDWRGAWRNPGA